MRLVFAHDHTFTQYDGQLYSPGRLPYSAWRRYLAAFDEVTVLARVRAADNEPEVELMQRADGPRVNFVGLRPARGLRRALSLVGRDKAVVDAAIAGAHALVARVPSEIGLAAASAARRAGIAVACEVVASAWDSLWHHGGAVSKLYAPLFEQRTRVCVANSRFALYVTRNFLQDKYPCQGTVAAASNVTVTTKAEVLDRRLRRIAGHAGPLVVGFVGSLHAAYKGLDVALRAIAKARERHINVVLQVVGEGPTAPWRRAAAELGVEGRVQFVGALPGSAAVLQWLDAVDVYVHPSLAEGLPRSLIEAMSRGCLCFGSRVGGIPELLDEAFLHYPADHRRLADQLGLGRGKDLRAAAAEQNAARIKIYAPERLEQIRADFFGRLAQHAANASAGFRIEARG
ncbi:MAG: glycosyltransferase [Steroidobacter sp.]